MAAANVLSVGTGAATSALKFTASPSTSPAARVSVQLKDDAGAYRPVLELSAAVRYVVLAGYRMQRLEGACGVFTG